MAVYAPAKNEGLNIQIEFVPRREGNMATFVCEDAHSIAAMEKLIAQHTAQQIISTSVVDGKHVLATRGDINEKELLKKLETTELGKLPEKKDTGLVQESDMAWVMYARGAIGLFGQFLTWVSATIENRAGKGFGAKMSAGANTLWLVRGGDKKEDAYALSRVEDALGERFRSDINKHRDNIEAGQAASDVPLSAREKRVQRDRTLVEKTDEQTVRIGQTMKLVGKGYQSRDGFKFKRYYDGISFALSMVPKFVAMLIPAPTPEDDIKNAARSKWDPRRLTHWLGSKNMQLAGTFEPAAMIVGAVDSWRRETALVDESEQDPQDIVFSEHVEHIEEGAQGWEFERNENGGFKRVYRTEVDPETGKTYTIEAQRLVKTDINERTDINQYATRTHVPLDEFGNKLFSLDNGGIEIRVKEQYKDCVDIAIKNGVYTPVPKKGKKNEFYELMGKTKSHGEKVLEEALTTNDFSAAASERGAVSNTDNIMRRFLNKHGRGRLEYELRNYKDIWVVPVHKDKEGNTSYKIDKDEDGKLLLGDDDKACMPNVYRVDMFPLKEIKKTRSGYEEVSVLDKDGKPILVDRPGRIRGDREDPNAERLRDTAGVPVIDKGKNSIYVVNEVPTNRKCKAIALTKGDRARTIMKKNKDWIQLASQFTLVISTGIQAIAPRSTTKINVEDALDAAARQIGQLPTAEREAAIQSVVAEWKNPNNYPPVEAPPTTWQKIKAVFAKPIDLFRRPPPELRTPEGIKKHHDLSAQKKIRDTFAQYSTQALCAGITTKLQELGAEVSTAKTEKSVPQEPQVTQTLPEQQKPERSPRTQNISRRTPITQREAPQSAYTFDENGVRIPVPTGEGDLAMNY